MAQSAPKGMTCKEAISAYCQSLEKKPEELTECKLYFQWPPIEKMDQALQTLKACQYLSLSSNTIEKIACLNGLPLRILSLGRNVIKKIEGLDAVKETLEELWLSHNQIEKLHPLVTLKNLRVICLACNNIASWTEVERLKDLPNLEEIVLVGNPISTQDPSGYRRKLISLFPPGKLRKVDGTPPDNE